MEKRSGQMRVIIAVCVASLLGASVVAQASSAPGPKAQQTSSAPAPKAQQTTNSAPGPKAQQAAAAPARGPAFSQHPCQLDIERLCKSVESGRGRKFYCLEKHKPELHPECRRFLAAVDQSYAAWAAERHESVAKMLADFYAKHEDKTRKHVRIRVRGPASPNMPAPASPDSTKPTPGAPGQKKPVPTSPDGNHESK